MPSPHDRLDTPTILAWHDGRLPRSPARKGALETSDHALDIVIDPSGDWRWKDEEDFAALCHIGFVTPQQADAIRREGLEVVRRLERPEPPFSSGWENWRPIAASEH